MKKYLKHLMLVLSLFVISAAGASYVSAQDSQRKNEGAKIEGRAGDTNFDVRIQGDKENRSRVPQPGEGERGAPGPQGPAGAPGPQGPAGPAGSSSSGFLGMDSTVALFVGLGVFAIVVIAIVAASRNGSRQV
ncbi:MAG TPA: hypothetical protein VFS81_01005 [Candidatus Binatia bacterium]|nr:hypothetical protein [Candidatus Binatia bacterium]HET9880307.1 hypothetical protein [Candidatus Binatia bacterium]HYQ98321.1 hypothetical protein [Candidatus Nitrosocosmicus sp.]